MTDQEIIQGLLDRDNAITEEFLYIKCKPLLTAIMRNVFSYPVEYNEMVSELYNYLIANDGQKLRQFQYRSTIYQWIKVVAIRFFINHRDAIIEDNSKEPLYCQSDKEVVDNSNRIADRIDVERMLGMLKNQRYAEVIRQLVLRDAAPEEYAKSIGVTVDNLYNIKKRAMSALLQILLMKISFLRHAI